MTMATVDLRTEAAAEVRRLSAARALTRDGDERALAQLEGDGPWLMLGRRTPLKRAMGRRVCFLWRVALEDASGRLVASRVVAIAIDVTHLPRKAERRSWIRALVRYAEAVLERELGCQEREPFPSASLGAGRRADTWHAEAARMVDAFIAARLSRERAIASHNAAVDDVASQPGLFDRRADRTRQAQMQASDESAQLASERLRAVAGAGSLTIRPARLMLVLVP